MRKSLFFILFYLFLFDLAAQDSVQQYPSFDCKFNYCSKENLDYYSKWDFVDSVKNSKMFSIGLGMQIKTIGIDYVDFGSYPYVSPESAYINGFAATSPFAPSAEMSMRDKTLNIYSLSFCMNPKKRDIYYEGPSSDKFLEGKMYQFKFSYAMPLMKKLVYKNVFVPYIALNTKMIYSLNKFDYYWYEWSQGGYYSRDESYFFLLSLAPSVIKHYKRLMFSLSYEIVFSGIANIDHSYTKWHYYWHDPPYQPQTDTSIHALKNEYLGFSKLSKSRLMFNNFNISIGYSFKSNPYYNYRRNNDTNRFPDEKRNLITFNILGASLVGASAGYSRVLYKKDKQFVEAGIGVGVSIYHDLICHPYCIYYDNRLGIGTGFTKALQILDNENNINIPHPIVSFRLDSKKRLAIYRINFTPLFIFSKHHSWFGEEKGEFWPWLEMQFGFRF